MNIAAFKTADEGIHLDFEMTIGMTDYGQRFNDLDIAVQFFPAFAVEGLPGCFVFFGFASGKLPESAQVAFGGPLLDVEFIFFKYNPDGDAVLGYFSGGGFVGITIDGIGFIGDALFF